MNLFQVHHDMTAPLSHYFVFTGHNSYLTGNQLSSGCSDVPIIKALKRGVRVIELDLWPNLSRDNVHVLHGGYGYFLYFFQNQFQYWLVTSFHKFYLRLFDANC